MHGNQPAPAQSESRLVLKLCLLCYRRPAPQVVAALLVKRAPAICAEIGGQPALSELLEEAAQHPWAPSAAVHGPQALCHRVMLPLILLCVLAGAPGPLVGQGGPEVRQQCRKHGVGVRRVHATWRRQLPPWPWERAVLPHREWEILVLLAAS